MCHVCIYKTYLETRLALIRSSYVCRFPNTTGRNLSSPNYNPDDEVAIAAANAAAAAYVAGFEQVEYEDDDQDRFNMCIILCVYVCVCLFVHGCECLCVRKVNATAF